MIYCSNALHSAQNDTGRLSAGGGDPLPEIPVPGESPREAPPVKEPPSPPQPEEMPPRKDPPRGKPPLKDPPDKERPSLIRAISDRSGSVEN